MSNYFDQYDEPAEPSGGGGGGNYFDQFDPPPRQQQAAPQQQQAAPQENYFDQFDPPPQRQQREAPPEAEGQFGAGVRQFLHDVPSALGGIAGGALAGGAAGLIGGPIGAVAGAIGGGFAGGYAGGKAAEVGADLLGFDDSQQLAVNAAAHPWTTAAASAGTMVLGGGIGGASRLARGVGAGLGGGIEAGRQYLSDEEFSPAKLAANVAGGAAFARPYEWTNKISARGAQLAEGYRGPPSSNSNPGPTASSSVAEPMTAPSKNAAAEAAVGDPHNKPTGSEKDYSKPPATETGDHAGTQILTDQNPIDATLKTALDAENIQTRVDPNGPTQYGAKLDAEFPRVPPQEGVTPGPPVTPVTEPPQGRLPTEEPTPPPAMAAARPDDNVLRGPAPPAEEGIPDFLRRGPDNKLAAPPAAEPPPAEMPAPTPVSDQLKAANAASKEFRKAQADYRARRIGDEEFLAAKAKHDAASRTFDESRGEAAPKAPTPGGRETARSALMRLADKVAADEAYTERHWQRAKEAEPNLSREEFERRGSMAMAKRFLGAEEPPPPAEPKPVPDNVRYAPGEERPTTQGDPPGTVRSENYYTVAGERDALGQPWKNRYREEYETITAKIEKSIARLEQRLKTVEATGRDPRVKGWRGEAEAATPRLKDEISQAQGELKAYTRLRDKALSRNAPSEKMWADMTPQERATADQAFDEKNFLAVKKKEPNITREEYEARRTGGMAAVKAWLGDEKGGGRIPLLETIGDKLKAFVADERGGGRIGKGKKPVVESTEPNAAPIKIFKNEAGQHFLVQGDKVISSHKNMGQAFIALNKAQKAAGISQEPVPATAKPAAPTATQQAALEQAAVPKGQTGVGKDKITPRGWVTGEDTTTPITPRGWVTGYDIAPPRGEPAKMSPTGGERPPVTEGAGSPPPPPPEGPLIKPPGGADRPPGPPKNTATPLSIAEKFDDTMYRHNTEASARTVNYENRIKDGQKIYPTNDASDEAMYHAREKKGGFEALPAKQQEAYNKTIEDLNTERVEAFKELIRRKNLTEEEEAALADYGDQNYQHRIRKLPRGEDQEFSAADPISGYVGAHKPGALKALTFKEGVADDGSRVVISHPGEGEYNVWENGKTRTVAGPEEFRNGQTLELDGKKYTIERGLTKNIETHARDESGKPLEYYHSALLSATQAHQQVVTRLEFLKMMDDFKANPALDSVRMKAGKDAPSDWKESKVPELKGFVMDPYMRSAIDNNYKPGLGVDVPKIMQDFNRFATKSIFWNPVPHGMNAQIHHIVARGEDWFSTDPKVWKNFGKSLFEAWDAVINRTPELERLLKAGAPMVMSGIDRQNWRDNLGKLIERDFKANPKRWEELAREAKLGKPIDAIRYIYDGAQRALWTYSDFLMASRIRELEMRGMSTAAAIKDASVHMPDYRVPIKLFGSTFLPKLAADNNVMMFGRYHMGMMKSLIHMGTDLLGPNATTEERRKAFGNVVALGVMGMFVKPALDYLVQKVTGNENAKMQPRGPLGPITGAHEALVTGERSVGSVLSNLNTINPSMKLVLDTLSNRDFAGRQIIEPMAPTYKKAAQYAEHVAGTAVSPYATFGPTIQPGRSAAGPLSTLGQQLFDVKVPTDAQVRGKNYGMKQNKKSERQRDKKPRGWIEYGAGQVGN